MFGTPGRTWSLRLPVFKDQLLACWGNYPVQRGLAARPERVRELAAAVSDGSAPTVISRGLGRSYGDASLNGHVILHERLNRFLSFDASSGVLECEAGVSFAEVIEAFLLRGYFPPVTPGTKFVTLGGAVAADVHGKNHHVDGSIANFVDELMLLTSGGERLVCSRSQNAQVFWATIGGMGLTGAILSLKLRLKPVPSAFVNVEYRRAANLDKTLELFAGEHGRRTYSVAWIDCLSGGASLGRSVLMAGEFAAPEELPAAVRGQALEMAERRSKSVPFFLPGFALNSLRAARSTRCITGRTATGGKSLISIPSFTRWTTCITGTGCTGGGGSSSTSLSFRRGRGDQGWSRSWSG